MPRLLRLMAMKSEPCSYHCSVVAGTVTLKRMGSGRWTDSILITSAPSVARYWVPNGPAQKAVRSKIRTPSSGNSTKSSFGVRWAAACSDCRQRAPHRAPPGGGPTWPAAASSGCCEMGARGQETPPEDLAETARGAATWGKLVTEAPLETGAAGTRKAAARSRISAWVRPRNQGPISALTIASSR